MGTKIVDVDEIALFENLLDSFDRLYDQESSVVDIYALLFATTKALPNSSFAVLLNTTTSELLKIVRSGCSVEEQNSIVLDIVQPLREVIAAVV
ncbi:hypothetical protein [Fluviicoccus keumensis]|uniref:hypothetical protein n=1 Tax=Fluviicoccus keumensis TaxID=1435465 RepID=UPI00102B2C0A|nr:hypothetical protein [Fluviicoccus keumensis]